MAHNPASPIFAAAPLAIGLLAMFAGDQPETVSATMVPAGAAPAPVFTPDEQRLVNEHVCETGLPSNVNLAVRRGYVRSYLPEARIPYWVAYHVTPDYLNTPDRSGRYSTFRVDPDVENRVSTTEYVGLLDARGYARGHLAPYGVMGGDRDGDGLLSPEDADEDETVFEANYMSNIAPQIHDGFNGSGGLWYDLERLIQDTWVRDQSLEVCVFAGTVLGHGRPEVVGPDHDIVVPPMFFKIVVRQVEDEELPRVLAFLFPHQRVRHGDLQDFLVSIDVIESLTGLDFFNVFGEEVQVALEDVDTFQNWDSFL